MEHEGSKFEGWAVVELFGHTKEIGFVTTQYFGGTALFQIDVPGLAEREFELTRPEWIDAENGSQLAPIGTKVKRAAVQGRTRLVGPGAVYALNPCDEGTARAALERSLPRKLAIVSLPAGAQLTDGQAIDVEDECDEDDDADEL